MFELKVKNNRGDILSFLNNRNYTVYRIDGLTPPKATINSSVNTTTDGSSINSARLENRNIVIYMTIDRDVEKNRLELYKYFPSKKTITLYFKNGSRDVYIEGTVELVEVDIFANKQVAQISIICPKPYFRDIQSLITAFSDIKGAFEFPFSIAASGVEFSTLTTNVRKAIVNTGDVESGLIIELYATGNVVNPIIYDVINRTYMRLNFTMKATDKIVINTNVGEKSITLIRDGVSYNALGYMVKDSTWFVLEAGENVYSYDCEDGNSNLQLTFTTPLLYSGV